MKYENAKSQECKCLYEGKIARFTIAHAVYLFAGFLRKISMQDISHHRQLTMFAEFLKFKICL